MTRHFRLFCLLLLVSWIWNCGETTPAQEPHHIEPLADENSMEPAQEPPVSQELSKQEKLPEPLSEEGIEPEDGPETVAAEETSVDAGEPIPEPDTKPVNGTPDATPELPSPERTGPKPGWASLQWPPVMTSKAGQTTGSIYGQVYASGITDANQSQVSPRIQAQLGYGPIDKDPQIYPGSWQWTGSVSFHKHAGPQQNNYEFKGTLTIAQPGFYRYTYRYAIDNGPWLLGDRNDYGRSGSADGATLQEMGTLVVVQPGSQVTLASYNLHCMVEKPTQRIQEIAKQLAQLKPDLVALQEVCQATTGGDDTASQLAKLLNQSSAGPYQYRFMKTHQAQHDGMNFSEGIGLLSRLPILEEDSTLLPPTGQPPTGAFPRKALWARVATPVGILSFAATHLSYRQEHEAWRVKQVDALKQWLLDNQRLAEAWIVGGDFNAAPDSAPIKAMLSNQNGVAFVDMLQGHDAGFTFAANNPFVRIDYLFLHQPTSPTVRLQPSGGKRILTQPTNGLYLSDHVGILSILQAN